MIKQDYLIRMIQEIISLIVNAILNKKKFRKDEWTEYDCLTRQILGVSQEELLSMSLDEMIDCYEGDPNRMGKIELAAVTLLKVSDEAESDILQKSKLRQDGLSLLKYVQKESSTFSIQRTNLIRMIEINESLKCRRGNKQKVIKELVFVSNFFKNIRR